MVPKFDGPKYFTKDGWYKIVKDEFGNETKKQMFYLTDSYKAYLAEKPSLEFKDETIKLGEKLKYQKEVYGEVDEVDLQNYLTRLKKEYKMN